MAGKFLEKYQVLARAKFSTEKLLIERHFNCIKCFYTDDSLICNGYFQPTSTLYRYKIQYNGRTNPTVTVIEPQIEYNDDIHLYKSSNSLCLHYPPDKSWTFVDRLYDTIVPWVHEWFVFYELYKITGRWEHPYVPHKAIQAAE